MARASLKEQIVVGALETLHRKGFNGSSVEDITTAAKVPKGSFYNHFGSKEELAVAALDRYWQRVLGSLDQLNDARTPPLARLKKYFRYLIKVSQDAEFRTGCFIGNMSTEMPDQSRMIRERLAIQLAAWSRGIESCVREAQADGSMRNDIEANTIASFLLNSWEGAVLRSKVDRDPSSLAAFEHTVFKVFAS
jgi:TetR/AcrR family transcriptional repressor of nem operon